MDLVLYAANSMIQVCSHTKCRLITLCGCNIDWSQVRARPMLPKGHMEVPCSGVRRACQFTHGGAAIVFKEPRQNDKQTFAP